MELARNALNRPAPHRTRVGAVRLAHVVSHPIQYFAPLYRELTRRAELELTVYFLSDASVREYFDPGFGRVIAWDSDLLSGYKHHFLPSARGRAIRGSSPRISWDVVRQIRNDRPEVIWGHGYAQGTVWAAFLAGASWGAKALLRDEQTMLSFWGGWRGWVKRLVLPRLFSRVDGLYIGEQNKRWLRHCGVESDRLHPARYCVDTGAFGTVADSCDSQRSALREKLGINPDLPLVLFSGKLSAHKGLGLLLDAFAVVRRQLDCALLVVGDGTEAPKLRAKVSALGLEEDVFWAGFLNQSELPPVYATSDIFVLPSAAEPWGLVVNEAMSFGLPVIVSDRVGCAADLVVYGENGFIFAYPSVDGLARALARLVADPRLRERMGRISREIVRSYTVRSCADGIVAACLDVLAGTNERDSARA